MRSAVLLIVGMVLALSARGTMVLGLGTDAAANRAAIQRAVDAACAQGGGKVEVPVGTWPTGSIQLKSGVELYLPKGAVLKGSVDRRDYNPNDAFPENKWSDGEEWSGGHLVWALRAENVAITGGGTIDGNGPAFFGDCDQDSWFPWYKYGLKLHPTDREWFRPGMMLAFFQCRGIRLEGVTLANTPAWTCHIRCSDGVDIRGVTVDADRTIANSDGFSLDCTRNVHVEKCVLKTGDDSFAIRASCEAHAATNLTENIVIRDCDVWSCCYGIRFGIGTGTIRNVSVEDVRVHEAAGAGFGFTPAWVDAGRNCYIENISLKNCLAEDCVQAVEAWTVGDSKIVGIRFEDCVFRTLLPGTLNGSDRIQMAFVNCERRAIEAFKVRHHRGWNEPEIRNRRFEFVTVGGDRSKIRVENCLPRPFGSNGILLLAFDDRNFADWERAIPLFAKYGAHASFFISGEFDAPAVTTSKKLLAAGHTIGLHGRQHANVPEAIAQHGVDGWWQREVAAPKRRADVSYVPIRSFAYPNNRRDDTSDAHLLSRFTRLRAGIPGLRPYDPEGKHVADLKPLLSDERMFVPVRELPGRHVLGGIILGEVYHTDIEEVAACIRRAGERKEALLFTSHGISPDAKGINLKTEWLEKILAAAQEAGVEVLGFDEIPVGPAPAPEPKIEPGTFADYPASSATAGESASFTLVPESTGTKEELQPLGRDGWRRVNGDGRAFVSVVQGGDPSGKVVRFTGAPGWNEGAPGSFAHVVQPIGHVFTRGKVSVQADLSTPDAWHFSSRWILLGLGNRALAASRGNEWNEVGAFAGFCGPDARTFSPSWSEAGRKDASDDGKKLDASCWYRVKLTVDLDAKTSAFRLYRIGGNGLPLDAGDAGLELVYEKTGCGLYNDLGELATILVSVYGPGSTASTKEQVWLDNVKVFAGDFATGQLVYGNDFDVRTRKAAR